jgi:mono/diheme cytochrome c family protein
MLHGQKAMPGIGRLMSDAQVAAVVTYIRTHFGNDYKEPVTTDAVKKAR